MCGSLRLSTSYLSTDLPAYLPTYLSIYLCVRVFARLLLASMATMLQRDPCEGQTQIRVPRHPSLKGSLFHM